MVRCIYSVGTAVSPSSCDLGAVPSGDTWQTGGDCAQEQSSRKSGHLLPPADQGICLEIDITLSCVSLDDIFKYHLMMLTVSTDFFHQKSLYYSGREEAVRNIRRWGDGEVGRQVWWHNRVHSALWHRTVAVVPDIRGQEEGRGQSGREEGRWPSFLE